MAYEILGAARLALADYDTVSEQNGPTGEYATLWKHILLRQTGKDQAAADILSSHASGDTRTAPPQQWAWTDRLFEFFAGAVAEDALLIHPFGNFEGSEALAQFYGGIVMHADTALTVTSATTEANTCIIEVTGISPQAPDKPQYALDLFEVNESGKIVRLAIYYRNFDLG